jgi:hypothetical protein
LKAAYKVKLIRGHTNSTLRSLSKRCTLCLCKVLQASIHSSSKLETAQTSAIKRAHYGYSHSHRRTDKTLWWVKSYVRDDIPLRSLLERCD